MLRFMLLILYVWRRYELMPNHCLHHCFPTVDCSRFDVIRPVFEATLREFGVQQKVMAQPHIYFGMWPAWLRGTSWAKGKAA